MTHLDYATALVRMSRHKIGIAEACALFCLGAGCTANQVAKATGSTRDIVSSRLLHLRRKKLVEIFRPNDGSPPIYRPSKLGREVIKKTLNIKPTPKHENDTTH